MSNREFDALFAEHQKLLGELQAMRSVKRTWVGLTPDRRIELAQDVDWAAGAYCEYAEKVEAELKEKNNA